MQAVAAHGHEPRAVVWPQDPQFATASAGKIAMWIFLVSDAFAFFGLLLAYGILRGETTAWHHPGEPDLSVVLGALLTAVLIASSVSMIFAYDAALRGDRRQTSIFLGLTASLGIAFLIGQYAEYFGILRSEEHTSELQSRLHLVCRLLLEKKKNQTKHPLHRYLTS